MAESIPLAELEFRILLLPPISRAVHLGGPVLHARRLVQIWRDSEMTKGEIDEVSDDELIARRMVIDDDGGEAKAINAELRARTRARASQPAVRDLAPRPSDCADRWGGDDVPLSQAFRLLSVEEIGRAIARTAAKDYVTDWTQFPTPIERWKDDDVSAFVDWHLRGHRNLSSDPSYDPDHWPLPPLNDLLPELNDAAWQALLDGELQIEAIRYERGKVGKVPRAVSLIELPRLSPDWRPSRLCRGDQDEWLDARVRRAPAEQSVEPPKRQRPLQAGLKAAMEEIAQGYPKDAARPTSQTIWDALKTRLGPGVTRLQARKALAKYAPQLRLEPGRPRLRKPPT